MFFQSKIDRVVKRKENEVDDKMDQGIELEKGDIPAMLLAALLTFLPAILIVALLFIGVAHMMFR